MAKSPMKNIWNDKKKEDERLQKVTMKKKAENTNTAKTAGQEAEGSTELKAGDK